MSVKRSEICFNCLSGLFGQVFGQILTRFLARFLTRVFGPKIQLCRFYRDEKYSFAVSTWTKKYSCAGSTGTSNTVLQFYWDGEIQFYSTFSILTLVKTSQNRGKPCIKNPMY